jgi:hypothetical protein
VDLCLPQTEKSPGPAFKACYPVMPIMLSISILKLQHPPLLSFMRIPARQKQAILENRSIDCLPLLRKNKTLLDFNWLPVILEV